MGSGNGLKSFRYEAYKEVDMSRTLRTKNVHLPQYNKVADDF